MTLWASPLRQGSPPVCAHVLCACAECRACWALPVLPDVRLLPYPSTSRKKGCEQVTCGLGLLTALKPKNCKPRQACSGEDQEVQTWVRSIGWCCLDWSEGPKTALITPFSSALISRLGCQGICPYLFIKYLFIYLVVLGLSCSRWAPQLWHVNSQLWHACEIQFPDPGPLHWECGVLPTAPPGKPLSLFLRASLPHPVQILCLASSPGYSVPQTEPLLSGVCSPLLVGVLAHF